MLLYNSMYYVDLCCRHAYCIGLSSSSELLGYNYKYPVCEIFDSEQLFP